MNRSLNFFKSFLTNNTIPLPFKKMVLQSFIISKVLYYAPHLLAQIKLERLEFKPWFIKVCYGVLVPLQIIASTKDIIRNSFISLYALSRDLQLPPLAAICAVQQLKCFLKWKSSNCIIRDLIRFIPPMSHYSWTKESKSLKKKLKSLKNTKECSKFAQLRSKYLNFINDLYDLFLNKYHSLYIFFILLPNRK